MFRQLDSEFLYLINRKGIKSWKTLYKHVHLIDQVTFEQPYIRMIFFLFLNVYYMTIYYDDFCLLQKRKNRDNDGRGWGIYFFLSIYGNSQSFRTFSRSH